MRAPRVGMPYADLVKVPVVERARLLDVAWWDRTVPMPAADRDWFQRLPYHQPRIAEVLTDEARRQYRRQQIAAALDLAHRDACPDPLDRVRGVEDPEEAFRLADALVDATRVDFRKASFARLEALRRLQRERPHVNLADTLRVTGGRVRQLRIQARIAEDQPEPDWLDDANPKGEK